MVYKGRHQYKKKTFSFGHCPNEGGGGLPIPLNRGTNFDVRKKGPSCRNWDQRIFSVFEGFHLCRYVGNIRLSWFHPMVGLRLQQGIGWECPDHWDIWTTHLNISLFNFCFWIVYQVQIFWLYYYKINVLVSMFTRLFPHRRKHQGPSRCSWSCPQWPERKKIREGSIWNIFQTI